MKNKKGTIIGNIFKVLYYIVISFVCLIVAFLIFNIVSSQINAKNEKYRPKLSIYTIVSPSMTPVINVYDVVFNVHPSSENDIKVGDIITYISKASNSEGMTITHRVIEVSELPDGTKEYLTQGDNNSEPDPLYVTYDQVLGKELFIIPYVGRVQFLIANQKGWLILIMIPIIIYIIYDVYKLIKLLRLKNKVDEITGEEPERLYEEKQNKKQKEETRKKEIKEQKEQQVIRSKAITRDPNEPTGFLDEYTETIVSVGIDSTNDQVIIPEEEEEIVEVTDLRNNQLSTKKNIKVENKEYEILETDELTSKMKEYDDRINKLNQMIADMQGLSTAKQEDKVEEVFPEFNDYLTGDKIKVVAVEETKNKRLKKPIYYVENDPDYQIKKLPQINITISGKKKQAPVEEPPKKKKKKKKLNLNPTKVKQINRLGKKVQEQPKPEPIKEEIKQPIEKTKKSKKERINRETIKRAPLIQIKKMK